MTDQAPGRLRGRRSGDAGVTLIELMVVVAIVSILSFGAILGMGGPLRGTGGQDVDAVAQLLMRDIGRARSQARIAGTHAGLRPQSGGWVVTWRGPQGWHDMPAEGQGASLWLADGRRVADPSRPGDPPPIRILPDGRITPFSVTISLGGRSVSCLSDGWEAARCSPR